MIFVQKWTSSKHVQRRSFQIKIIEKYYSDRKHLRVEWLLMFQNSSVRNTYKQKRKQNEAGRKIAPNTGANATKFFALATKSLKLVANLATRISNHTLIPRDLAIVEDLLR